MSEPDDDLRGFDGVTRLFPLPGVVLFPHVVAPLHIFEPRYRQMTRDALEGDRLITIIQLKPGGDPAEAERPPIEQVGCLGRIVSHQELPDGRFYVLLAGLRRVRIVRELDVATPYRQALVELVRELPPDAPSEGGRLRALARRMHEILVAGRALVPELDDALRDGTTPLNVLADLAAHVLCLTPAGRQELLDEPHAGRRAERLIELLAREHPRPARPRTYPPPISLN